jgi:hypothetical protein
MTVLHVDTQSIDWQHLLRRRLVVNDSPLLVTSEYRDRTALRHGYGQFPEHSPVDPQRPNALSRLICVAAAQQLVHRRHNIDWKRRKSAGRRSSNGCIAGNLSSGIGSREENLVGHPTHARVSLNTPMPNTAHITAVRAHGYTLTENTPLHASITRHGQGSTGGEAQARQRFVHHTKKNGVLEGTVQGRARSLTCTATTTAVLYQPLNRR